MARTEPTHRPTTRDQWASLASSQKLLRAALHSTVEDALDHPETWYSDDGDHTFTLGGLNGDTVLVVDGADVAMSDDFVIDLVHRMLIPICREPDCPWDRRDALRAITRDVERRYVDHVG